MESQVNSYRYERKIHISELSRKEIESIVKLHPKSFKEIYYKRFVNNIYFDSIDFSSYYDNVDGNQHRVKYRIRWYGELFGHISNPVLELKIKNGLVGRKESYQLASFEMDSSICIAYIRSILNQSGLPDEILIRMNILNPVLLNRYSRKYFISSDGLYRVTLDNGLEYYQLKNNNNSFANFVKEPEYSILEIKYDNQNEASANYIVTKFPFRLTKNSKYVNGVNHVYWVG